MCKTKILIDIHNFGYSIFTTRFKWLKILMNFLERFWIKIVGDKYYAVSDKMKRVL